MSTNVIGKSSSRRSVLRYRRWRLGKGDMFDHYQRVSEVSNDSRSASSQLPVVLQAAPGGLQAIDGHIYSQTHGSSLPPRPVGGRLKRVMDIVIALCTIVLASPIMLFTILLLKASDGGAAIYAHTRIGFGGVPFRCYKFRTMIANSDEVLRQHLQSDPAAAAEWEEHRKLRNDPRITRLGLLLRKSSIDELPQLFNVLKGEMSCVGPRPIVADELSRYGRNAADYLSARPGLTGLWQVTGRSSTDYASRVAFDSSYVRNWSLRSDAAILLRTVFAVLRFDEAS